MGDKEEAFAVVDAAGSPTGGAGLRVGGGGAGLIGGCSGWLGAARVAVADFALFQPSRDRPADGKDAGRRQQQPGHQVQKGHLRRAQQNHSPHRAAKQTSQGHRQNQPRILANVVSVGRNRGELAGP